MKELVKYFIYQLDDILRAATPIGFATLAVVAFVISPDTPELPLSLAGAAGGAMVNERHTPTRDKRPNPTDGDG